MQGLYSVNILDKQRDIFFGMPAIEYVFQKIDFKVFDKVNGGNFEAKDLKTIVHFVYAGLMGGCERRDEAQDFSYADVYTEVDRLVKAGEVAELTSIVGKAFSEGLPEPTKAKAKKKGASIEQL